MNIEQAKALVGTKKQSLVGVPTELMPFLKLPDNAPPMPHALLDPSAGITQFFPSTYFSMEELDSELKLSGDEAIVLTVTGVSYELVYDPMDKPTVDDWQLCLRFKERKELLVMGKNRAKAFAGIVKSRTFSSWAVAVKSKNTKIALLVDRIKGKEQLCIVPHWAFVTAPIDMNDLNKELGLN